MSLVLASDKTLNCPHCIRPLCEAQYGAHVAECGGLDLLVERMERHGYARAGAVEDPVAEYLDFVRHDRAFFPPRWCDDLQEHNTAFYLVDPASAEARALQALASKPLRRVERVQNKELFLAHAEYRAKNPDGKEAMLFHGSRAGAYNLICNQGLDGGHSRDGTYGKGIYLSSCMTYSTGYSRRADGTPGDAMLVCRTWLTPGAIVRGNIHVVHDDFAALPEYLVYY